MILGGSPWFGWFGFNGGSALGANAACTGIAHNESSLLQSGDGLLTPEWRRLPVVYPAVGNDWGSQPSHHHAAAGFITPLGIAMGAIGSVAAFYAIKLLGRSRIDDSSDVFACQGVGGIVGLILTGFFATTQSMPMAQMVSFMAQALSQKLAFKH